MRRVPFIFICLYLVIRMFFMPMQHTGDGWGYACEILKGDFFSPHHILYKPFMFFILKVSQICQLSIEPILLFSSINLLFSGLVLYIFYLILNQLSEYHQMNFWLLFLVSFTFGFIRYSGENETYIIPLFFSLCGTYACLQKKWGLGYTLLSIAVLFHQIHVFWLLAFFVPQNNEKPKWKYLIMSIGFIVLFYIGYAFFYHKTWYLLPFNDVSEGLVETTPGLMNFIMTPISFVRTFLQFHGDMKPILFSVETRIVSLVFVSVCIVLGLIKIRSIIVFISQICSKFKLNTIQFRNVFFAAFSMHLLFAFYSVGNAEFMVMLPFLLILWQYQSISQFSLKGIHYIGIFFCFWNLGFYLIPYSFYDFNRLREKMNEIDSIVEKRRLVSDQGMIITSNNVLFENFSEYNQLVRKTKTKYKIINPKEFSINANKYSWYLTDELNNDETLNRKTILKKDQKKAKIIEAINHTKVSKNFYLRQFKITNSNQQNP